MLNEILELLKQGKAFSLQDIAETMHTDVQDVKVKIDYLERNHYIKKVQMLAGCSGGCRGCSSGSGCSKDTNGPIMWELTK